MGIVIANIIAIYRRELQSYFVSPLAYGIASAFWFLAGLFFVMILLGPEGILVTVSAYDLQGQQMGVPAPPVNCVIRFSGVLVATICPRLIMATRLQVMLTSGRI